MAGWIKMPLGTEVGLGPGHIVLGGEPVPPPQKGDISSQCSAHVCYGEMAGLIKIPLGMEEGLGPGHIVLDGDTADPHPPKKGTAPQFLADACCGQTAGLIKNQDATWYKSRHWPR